MRLSRSNAGTLSLRVHALCMPDEREHRKTIEKWASRCRTVGLRYLVEDQSTHLTRQFQLTHIAVQSSTGGADAAIDAYIAECKDMYASVFARAPRERCQTCGKRKRWYCRGCLTWLPSMCPPALPVCLPFDLEVIVRDDVESASGIHAAALASPVRVRSFPEGLLAEGSSSAEDYVRYNAATTFVLYPSADALTAVDLAEVLAARPQAELLTVLAIDSKWNNDGAVLSHPALRGLRHVRLSEPPAHSRIWRAHGRAVGGCVSTIEAIYCMVRELHAELDRLQMHVSNASAATAPTEQLLQLFAMTRHAIDADCNRNGEPPPYAEEHKVAARLHKALSAKGQASTRDRAEHGAEETREESTTESAERAESAAVL